MSEGEEAKICKEWIALSPDIVPGDRGSFRHSTRPRYAATHFLGYPFSGYTSAIGCDSPDSELDWPYNDGRACFKPWFYDHGDHLHVDHINRWFLSDPYGQSDTVTSITNQRVRIYAGNCTTSFPNCFNNHEVTGPIYDSSMGDLTVSGQNLVKDIGIRVGNAHALVVVDYTANGWLHINSQPTPVFNSAQEQEEIHL